MYDLLVMQNPPGQSAKSRLAILVGRESDLSLLTRGKNMPGIIHDVRNFTYLTKRRCI
ncbi:hypothetical protein [Nitrosopumilus adriaticus]|nr:hypothetical protein [Nitrosopumilus adriaticus]